MPVDYRPWTVDRMKNIPNLFTLLNLIFGCIAIVYILQVGQSIVVLNDQTGAFDPFFPEKLAWGSMFIFLAAVVDFLDGFVARLFKASSKMGEQLDSLSDMVSFGVAPGMILYQLLRLSFAQQENGLDVSFMALLPAFVFTAAAAWRLAKFNISTEQTNNFLGLPTPSAGLLIASFPLIIWYEYFGLQQLLINKWFLYGVIVLVSYLMVSRLPLMALKFKDFTFRNNTGRFILIALSAAVIIVLALMKTLWLAWPVILVLYILLSLFYKEKESSKTIGKTTLDVTV
jgi:CDP-diacylglycerol---serine O-phosphatidyltransferase